MQSIYNIWNTTSWSMQVNLVSPYYLSGIISNQLVHTGRKSMQSLSKCNSNTVLFNTMCRNHLLHALRSLAGAKRCSMLPNHRNNMCRPVSLRFTIWAQGFCYLVHKLYSGILLPCGFVLLFIWVVHSPGGPE